MQRLSDWPGCTLLTWYMYEPPSLSTRSIDPALNWLPGLSVVSLIAARVPTKPTTPTRATATRDPKSLPVPDFFFAGRPAGRLLVMRNPFLVRSRRRREVFAPGGPGAAGRPLCALSAGHQRTQAVHWTGSS